MKRRVFMMVAFVGVACTAPHSRAEEDLPLTNSGELFGVTIVAACDGVFEVGECHASNGRNVSALDSFAWIIVNLPDAPRSSDYNRRSVGAFLDVLSSANEGDIQVFGRERAVRYLDRALADDTLPEALRIQAKQLKEDLASVKTTSKPPAR